MYPTYGRSVHSNSNRNFSICHPFPNILRTSKWTVMNFYNSSPSSCSFNPSHNHQEFVNLLKSIKRQDMIVAPFSHLFPFKINCWFFYWDNFTGPGYNIYLHFITRNYSHAFTAQHSSPNQPNPQISWHRFTAGFKLALQNLNLGICGKLYIRYRWTNFERKKLNHLLLLLIYKMLLISWCHRMKLWWRDPLSASPFWPVTKYLNVVP